ncbi:MAG: alpha/beta hydrolase [Aggregatilineales bacterium]
MTTSDTPETYRRIDDLLPAHWESTYVEMRDSTRLHAYLAGDSQEPAVILLHGFMSAGFQWMRVAMALEAEFYLVLPDMRGHGYSDGVENGFSLDILTQDLADVVDALELDKPIVLGHSLGAEIAVRFGATYPDVPRAIILEDPPMRSFNAGMFRQTDWYKDWIAQMQALKTQPHEERMTNGRAFLPPGTTLPQETDYVTQIEATALFNLDVLDHSEDMDYRAASPELIGKLSAPILLLTADSERGGSALPEGVKAITASWQDGQHIHFEGAGHFIHFEQLDPFIDAIRVFLSAES